MNELDKWAAEKCGMVLTKEGKWKPWEGENWTAFWTLDDARCREIVRWSLGISTEICFDSVTGNLRGVRGVYNKGFKSTEMKSAIEEAEIACIKAIMENET